jgi:hypothetical protein
MERFDSLGAQMKEAAEGWRKLSGEELYIMRKTE